MAMNEWYQPDTTPAPGPRPTTIEVIRLVAFDQRTHDLYVDLHR
jgi:hypothetical protein